MPRRVREVLLVSSRYDSFILEEEGQLTDLILQEYDRLNLRYAPRLNPTPNTDTALELLGSARRFDMVIVTMHPGETDPADFARVVRARHPGLPIVLLGYDNRELQELLESDDAAAFDRVFVWTGDARILLAIVSLVEDAWNVEHDVHTVGVEVIILIEDSVHYVSSVLPILYGKLLKQSQRLISEGVNLSHKVLRMRARPKVLLASTFEEAVDLYERYRQNVLGILSDVRFMRDGHMDPTAGAAFAARVHERDPGVPILLQSIDARNATIAHSLGIGFLHKGSPQLKHEVEQFMKGYFGFGPFQFRLPDGTIVGEAHNLRELRDCLVTIPAESVRYHAEGNHFSTWLKARTEFRIAARLRPRLVSDFQSIAELRQMLIDALDESRRESHRDAIADFSPDTFGTVSLFSRIGGGSLGGKARGLAFLNTLLAEDAIGSAFEGVEIIVPPMVAIGTDVFDRFIEDNDLHDVVRGDEPDETIRATFLAARLPADVKRALRRLVQIMEYPVAVRSSSLLEDSRHQPFAGVYETYMLANRGTIERRLQDLSSAIKLVYASTFSKKARTYLQATPDRPEKEKMAVIIQKLIGRPRGDAKQPDWFYPSFSGVGQSYNYYPHGHVKPRDGAARIAVGLGRLVVEGHGGLRFCPKYPRHLPQLSAVDDILANTQKEFDALALAEDVEPDPHRRYQPKRIPIDVAQGDPFMPMVTSVYDHAEHTVRDGIARGGTPLVTFAGVLKHDLFPLAELLRRLLDLATAGMGTPIEIEFAVDLEPAPGAPRTFACLQLRPLTVAREISRFDFAQIEPSSIVCQSPRALGNGRIEGIRDVVCVMPQIFDRRESVRTGADVAELNARLQSEGRPFLLIGPGRWGSADPWLGIPVNWGQIAGARIIVETGFPDMPVTPSEGSHFFHNMTAFQVAYMTTNPERGEGLIDWEWLLGHGEVRTYDNGLRWITLDEPLVGLVDGQTGCGAVVKSAQYHAS